MDEEVLARDFGHCPLQLRQTAKGRWQAEVQLALDYGNVEDNLELAVLRRKPRVLSVSSERRIYEPRGIRALAFPITANSWQRPAERQICPFGAPRIGDLYRRSSCLRQFIASRSRRMIGFSMSAEMRRRASKNRKLSTAVSIGSAESSTEITRDTREASLRSNSRPMGGRWSASACSITRSKCATRRQESHSARYGGEPRASLTRRDKPASRPELSPWHGHQKLERSDGQRDEDFRPIRRRRLYKRRTIPCGVRSAAPGPTLPMPDFGSCTKKRTRMAEGWHSRPTDVSSPLPRPVVV